MNLVPNQEEMKTIYTMAKSAHNSKFYDSLGGEAGILSIMLLARELEIPPMQAITGGIWNIQGKVEMSARMMNMKIRQAGHKLFINMEHTGCQIKGIRKDTQDEFTVSFTLKDAEKAGLSNRDNWKKYPREMCFARCLSIMARVLFPDVIGNCYVEGEVKEESIPPSIDVTASSVKNISYTDSKEEKKDQSPNSKNTQEPVEPIEPNITDEELEELLTLSEAIINPLKKEEVKDFFVKSRSKIKSSEMEKFRNRISTSVQKNEILDSQYMELVQLCGKLPIKEDRIERIEWLSKMKDTLTYDRYLEIKEEIDLEIPQS